MSSEVLLSTQLSFWKNDMLNVYVHWWSASAREGSWVKPSSLLTVQNNTHNAIKLEMKSLWTMAYCTLMFDQNW